MIDFATYKLIAYASTIVWLLPPIRQYKSFFFKYFLVLATMDFIVMGFYRITHLIPIQVYALFGGLLPITLLTTKIFDKKNLLFIMALIVSSASAFFFRWEYATIHLEIIQLIVLIIIIRRTLLYTAQTGKINLFHLVFILYQILSFLKLFLTWGEAGIGITYWSAINSFEILIGIFFLSFREESELLSINIRKTI